MRLILQMLTLAAASLLMMLILSEYRTTTDDRPINGPASALEPTNGSDSARGAVALPSIAATQFSEIFERPLFFEKRRLPVPVKPAARTLSALPVKIPDVSPIAPPKLDIAITLNGIAISRQFRRALITIGSAPPEIFDEGSKVAEWQLETIDMNKIVLRREHTRRTIVLHPQ